MHTYPWTWSSHELMISCQFLAQALDCTLEDSLTKSIYNSLPLVTCDPSTEIQSTNYYRLLRCQRPVRTYRVTYCDGGAKTKHPGFIPIPRAQVFISDDCRDLGNKFGTIQLIPYIQVIS